MCFTGIHVSLICIAVLQSPTHRYRQDDVLICRLQSPRYHRHRSSSKANAVVVSRRLFQTQSQKRSQDTFLLLADSNAQILNVRTCASGDRQTSGATTPTFTRTKSSNTFAQLRAANVQESLLRKAKGAASMVGKTRCKNTSRLSTTSSGRGNDRRVSRSVRRMMTPRKQSSHKPRHSDTPDFMGYIYRVDRPWWLIPVLSYGHTFTISMFGVLRRRGVPHNRSLC